METAANTEKIDPHFLEEAKKRSGENLSLCYQCLKCTAGCPTAPHMDIRPNNDHPDDPDGDEGCGPEKPCHLALCLL